MSRAALTCNLCLVMVCTAGKALAQTQTTVTIQDVLDSPEKWVNRTIQLTGEIRNPTVGDEVVRGTYQLRGPRGATITVQTDRLPGAEDMQGTFVVEGSIDVDDKSNCFLWEKSRQPWPPPAVPPAVTPSGPDLWTYLLIGGAVVLVALIVALVVVLTRKPEPAVEHVTIAPGGAHLGDTVAATAIPAAGAAETQEFRGPPAAPPTQEFLGANLTVTEGPDAGKSFALSKRSSTIGRLEGQDIRLTDSTVSREHARILVRDDGSLQLINESTKGTRVNGEEVESHVLADGDTIQLGGSALTVKAPSAGAGRAPAVAQATQEFVPEAAAPGAAAPGATQEFLGAQIEVESGPHAGDTHLLSKATTTVGRLETQDIALGKDQTVSREHCELRYHAGEFTLVAKPDKTVLVNGQEQVSVALADGDEIQMGGTKLRFRRM